MDDHSGESMAKTKTTSLSSCQDQDPDCVFDSKWSSDHHSTVMATHRTGKVRIGEISS